MEPVIQKRDYAGMSAVVERFVEPFVESRPRLSDVQRAALHDLLVCGSGYLGGSVYRCGCCGHHTFTFNSCGNRSCPRCSSNHTRKWMEARTKELLPIRYFQIVLTVPEELRALVKAHPELYGVLFRAAATAVKRLLQEKYGIKVGVLAVLHTWNRKLEFHPHIHCVVTAGGVTDAGAWRPLKVDTKGLGRLLADRFRSMFIKLAEAAVTGLQVPGSAVTRRWYVYVDEAKGGTGKLLAYLGRYVYRTAISDRRIIAIDGGMVRIQFTPNGSTTPQLLELPGEEFLERFLQHIPEKGFHRVRYYGLWSPACRKLLRKLQAELPPLPESKTKQEAPDAWKRCPACGKGILELVFDFGRDFDVETYVATINAALIGRPPPVALAA